MLRTSALLSTMVGAIAMTAVAVDRAPAGSTVTDFSAQQNQNKQNQNRNVNRGGGGGNVNRGGGGGGGGNVNRGGGGGGNANRNFNRGGGGGGGNANVNRAGGGGGGNANRNVNRGGGGGGGTANRNVNRGGGGGGGGGGTANVTRGGGGGGGGGNAIVNVNRGGGGGGNVNRNVNRGGGGGGGGNANVNVNRGGGGGGNANINRQNGTLQRTSMPIQRQGGSNLRVGPGKVTTTTRFVHTGPTVVVAGNRVVPVWRGNQRRIWWHGGWRTFVPLTALAVVTVGGAYLYADSYLAVSRPYCDGVTPDGCTLNWRRVDFAEGDSDWQCVRYCPRAGALPPPKAVALVAPPPLPPQGSCEITIYPEPNFGGTGVTTSEEQPQLSASGWQNQIASIQVKSGLWDLFSDEEFTGETLRLEPGTYADLGPEWTRRSGSLMCVQP